VNGKNNNAISLAGEFAVLSQLMLRGFDANMTLGRTKGVDILLSDPSTKRMLKLEVKTKWGRGAKSKLFGTCVSQWIMDQKHETIRDADLFYCFVHIARDTKHFRFFLVPSDVVADYVKAQHKLWLRADPKHRDTRIRRFRIGLEQEQYLIQTPTLEHYEDNWQFKTPRIF
jgi:hypothetical protein